MHRAAGEHHGPALGRPVGDRAVFGEAQVAALEVVVEVAVLIGFDLAIDIHPPALIAQIGRQMAGKGFKPAMRGRDAANAQDIDGLAGVARNASQIRGMLRDVVGQN